MVVAPHGLAAQSGLAVLREGGDVIEAALATAATLAVVYPHMSGIGGDAFWMIRAPGGLPRVFASAGRSPMGLDADFYRERGLEAIPAHGPLAANTVAGAVAAWHAVLDLSRSEWRGATPLERLLADAIAYSEDGYTVTHSQARTVEGHRASLQDQPGFASVFFDHGSPRRQGMTERQPRLAQVLRRLAQAGLDDFYRGELAEIIASDLATVGSPVTGEDLRAHRALEVEPLSVAFAGGRLFNCPPPTQGLASLLILALFERAGGAGLDPMGGDYAHLMVECTKLAFEIRDRYIRDPRDLECDPRDFLAASALDELAGRIDMAVAAPWGGPVDLGDTTWFGAIDGEGRAVSAIQSIFHGFGSGVVLPRTGICWHNRGSSFALAPSSPRYLLPRRQPFHTLNPAMAELPDGRLVSYGTMGGEGQPQTQAAVLSRYRFHGYSLQQAITAPRWLLGRAWGASTHTLKLESRFDPQVLASLAERGHDVEPVAPFDELMGHAGALALDRQGTMEGGADPRGDGLVAAF